MSADRWLPYGRQWIDDSDVEAISTAITADFLTTGPGAAKFEAALCMLTGAHFAAAVNSGTSALHCAFAACGLGHGDEFITSPMTFAATSNVGLDLGGKVRFADVDPDTGNIYPESIASLITERTKLVVPVDFTGLPADYDAIGEVVKDKGIRVVADAAHSLGATYKGKRVGTLADATTLSFHPVKIITTGEGGAVMTSDPELDRVARLFRSHGVAKTDEMMEREGPWYYEVQAPGLNYRITDFQCALGLSQLHRLDAFIARRREIVAQYRNALQGFESIRLPVEPAGSRSAWHLFIVRLSRPDAALRRKFFERLVELGLRVQVHYIPVYWHPRYQELGFQKGMCPNAEAFYNSEVSVPLFPRMTDSDVEWSIEQISTAIRNVLE